MISQDFVKFAARASIFSLGFLALFALASLHFHYRIVARDNVFILLNAFRNESIQPRVVILGDSHATFDILSAKFPREYYNFAYPSENWRKFVLRARATINLKDSLEYIIVPLDYYQFSPTRARHVFFTDYLFFSPIEDIRDVYHPSLLELFKAKVSSVLPLVSPSNRNTYRRVLGEDIYKFFGGKEKGKMIYIGEHNELRWEGESVVWSELPGEKKRFAIFDREKEQFLKPFIDGDLYNVFEEFFSFAQAHDVKVIGVFYPTTLEYNEVLSRFDKETGNITALGEKYKNLPLHATLDYRNVFDDHQEYFSDTDHLNRNGAGIFTEIILRDLEKIIEKTEP
ncbi:hypothetical protein A3B18_03585 [Candidatus Giovannonibacteria bacterium RIFCSPLOWO2_01_FULL_46_13]|uniref:Uncharacterized protein n=1 Tax=Candidatus Giovannonibacteria bacterium RIFCSPLOWO2_01_FULL_46_13 TaxID=1798352 RepID=A0A1F5X3E4_9BACT|nr:MAG: hypothetical protein A3B18_03585 [Candidatus Giovannonibacteria bacterium RIFCSPLOWO2_01_FULL_46_13]